MSELLKDGISIPKNRYYIFELNNQLRDLGAKNNRLFKELNELLEEKQISFKELINDEYQRKVENDILIANIFGDLKEFFEFTNEDLFKKVSKTEKMLLEDEVYEKMTEESKTLYRAKVVSMAKKKKKTEVEYLKELFEQTDRDDYHIGFKLFKRHNNTLRVFLYVTTIVLVTVVLSFFLSKYFINIRWFGFLILLIPVSQLFVQILNYILTRVVKPQSLPKLDYSKGIQKRLERWWLFRRSFQLKQK